MLSEVSAIPLGSWNIFPAQEGDLALGTGLCGSRFGSGYKDLLPSSSAFSCHFVASLSSFPRNPLGFSSFYK